MADESTFSGSDFDTAASATASPTSGAAETAQPSESSASPAAPARTDTAATGQAAAALTTTPGEKKGPIPFDVHETALKNARTKERDAALAEWRQQHGWAETVDRAAVQEAERLGQLYQRDRAGYIRAIVAEALADPDLSPQIRSLVGGVLAGGREKAAPTFEPDIPVYDERGHLVTQTFSADKVQELIKHAVSEALGREVGPIKQRIESADKARAQAREWQQAHNAIDRAAEFLETLPHAKEHEQELGDAVTAIIANDPDGQTMTPREICLLAYSRVMGDVVLPKLSTTERSKVLADLNRKPSASTVSPSSGTTAVPRPDAEKSWDELLREEAPKFLKAG